MKRVIIASVGILICLCLYWLWTSTFSSQQSKLQSSRPQIAPSTPIPAPPSKTQTPAPARERQSEETVEFPSIGKVKVTTREDAVAWKNGEGKSYSLPFKFQYAENGVWVRALYRRPGVEYPENSPKQLERLYAMRGDKIVGLPAKPPSQSLEDILTNAHDRVQFERASKIVLEHLVIDHSPDVPPEPAVIIKVWGVEKPWPDSPDSIPRMAMTYYLVTGYSIVDDAL